MEFSILGRVQATEGLRPAPVGAGKQRALLALLVIHRNVTVSSERLIDDLWGEAPPATAGKSLQVHVSHLRKALRHAGGRAGGERLETHGHGYALAVADDELDSARFEQAVEQVERSLAGGWPGRDGAAAVEADIDAALALWQGPALADVEDQPFVLNERARLEALRLAALGARYDVALVLGRHATAIAELNSLVGAHPLNEHFRAQLMLALYGAGRQAESLAAYREASALLLDELGLQPGPELRTLEARIHAQDPELASASPPSRGGPARSRGDPRFPRLEPGGFSPWGPGIVLAAGALIVAVAVAAVLAIDGGRGIVARTVQPLTDARHAVIGRAASGGRAALVVPVTGKPTDLAVGHGRLWVTTIAPASLSAVGIASRAVSGVVRLGGTPDAVALGAGSVWAADAERGELAQVDPATSRLVRRIAYPRAGRGLRRGDGACCSIAVAGGAVWLTNGSAALVRVDVRSGRVRTIAAGMALHRVAATGRDVWALSATRAMVLRLDAGRGRFAAQRIAIPGGSPRPFPAAIAATAEAVWVLEGAGATVSRVDPTTRRVATVRVPTTAVPADLAARGVRAWVTARDGTAWRVDRGRAEPIGLGRPLTQPAVDGSGVWYTTSVSRRRAG